MFAFSDDDLIGLLNFYASCVLICEKSKISNVDKNETADAMNVNDNETDRAIFYLGGGTICEIIKVNKRRSKNFKLTTNQRIVSKKIMNTAMKMIMPSDEKATCLPFELRDRDRGSMILSTTSFHTLCEKNQLCHKKIY